MKTLLLALCALTLTLTACQFLKDNVQAVNNRNADGTYKKASDITCSICGEQFIDSATAYWCSRKHVGLSTSGGGHHVALSLDAES